MRRPKRLTFTDDNDARHLVDYTNPSFMLPLNDGAVLRVHVHIQDVRVRRLAGEFNASHDPLYRVEGFGLRLEVVRRAPGDFPSDIKVSRDGRTYQHVKRKKRARARKPGGKRR